MAKVEAQHKKVEECHAKAALAVWRIQNGVTSEDATFDAIEAAEIKILAQIIADHCSVTPEKEVQELRDIIHWLLGANGDFPARQEGNGLYWWRTELRKRFEKSSVPAPVATPQKWANPAAICCLCKNALADHICPPDSSSEERNQDKASS